jgi:hypothetical protein
MLRNGKLTLFAPIALSLAAGLLLPCPSAAAATATFVRTDTATKGSWKGVYGGDGYYVVNDNGAYPPYVSVTPGPGISPWTWAGSTSDGRALQKSSVSGDRIAACWYSPSFTLDLNFNDAGTH